MRWSTNWLRAGPSAKVLNSIISPSVVQSAAPSGMSDLRVSAVEAYTLWSRGARSLHSPGRPCASRSLSCVIRLPAPGVPSRPRVARRSGAAGLVGGASAASGEEQQRDRQDEG